MLPLLLQYDKLVLVASGAGLTPMLSLINRYSETKEVHLLWTTRDRHMIRHFRTMVSSRLTALIMQFLVAHLVDFGTLVIENTVMLTAAVSVTGHC
jgi:ferredoxin-NADP reductase